LRIIRWRSHFFAIQLISHANFKPYMKNVGSEIAVWFSVDVKRPTRVTWALSCLQFTDILFHYRIKRERLLSKFVSDLIQVIHQ
jgi:hypothetical protein